MNINTNKTSIEAKAILPVEQINSFDINKLKELNNRSVEMIFAEKIENGLESLKKIEAILETNAIENKEEFDQKILIIILHNMACCYQKLKDYKNCICYLEAVIYHFDGSLEKKYGIKINCDYFMKNILEDQLNNSQLGEIILELRFSSKFHLQMCAVLSQAGDHNLALTHAKLSSLMCEDNLIKTYFLFKQMEKGKNVNDEDFPKYEEQIKISEDIVFSLYDRIINLRQLNNKEHLIYNNSAIFRKQEIVKYTNNEKVKETIRKIYGVIEPDDWIQLLNIGNIMYLSALTYDDLDLESDPKYELLRDAILEKTVMLTVSYFCIATEMRLLKNNNSNLNGHFWHKKAVEYSSNYLPVSSPIIKHYISSYYKHYGSNLDSIPENNTSNIRIDLIRSEIERDKDPMIFASCSKVVVNQLKKSSKLLLNNPNIESKQTNEYDVINNKIISSMTKLKENKGPKFKLNFFGLKNESCENVNQSINTDGIMKEKALSGRMKINTVSSKYSPTYNTYTNFNINTHCGKPQSNSGDKKNWISRDRKQELPSKTHREFAVYKKEVFKNLIPNKGKQSNQIPYDKKKAELKGMFKLKNGSNKVNLPIPTLFPSNKTKNKDSEIYLINKLLSNNKTRHQAQNITSNSISLSFNSLLKTFRQQDKPGQY